MALKPSSPRLLRKLILIVVGIVLIFHFSSSWSTANKYYDELAEATRSALSLKASRKWHRVAKVTIFGDGLSKSGVIDRAVKTHDIQNKLYEYEHFMGGSAAPEATDAAHTKSQAIYLLDLLKKEFEKPEEDRLEWVFWFEANTVILNPHIPLEIFLPPTNGSKAYDTCFETIHMLLTTNWNDLNTAIFPIHVHPWSIKLFETVLTAIGANPETTLLSFLQENTALRSNVTIVPPHWFSSMPVKVSWTEDPPEGEEKKEEEGYRYGHGAAITPGDLPEARKFDPNLEGLDPQPWKVRKGDMALSFPGLAADESKDAWMDSWLSIPEKPTEELFSHYSNAAYIERLEREIGAFWEEEIPRIYKMWRELQEEAEKGQEGGEGEGEKKEGEEEKKEGEGEKKEKRSELEENAENSHEMKEEERRKEADKEARKERDAREKTWMERLMGAEHGERSD